MKYFVIFLILIGFLGTIFATEFTPNSYATCVLDPNNPPVSCDGTIGALDYPKTPEGLIPAPLKQMTLGIKLGHIICDAEHYPAYNVHYKPACVFPDSEGTLLTRGWAKLRLLLPAGPDPIKELELTGQNEMSYRITGNISYGDDMHPLGNDRIREIAWEYSQKYHPGKQYLEYSIPSVPPHNSVEEKVEFDLLEWGNYSDCWNLKLRIIDVKNNPVYEDNSIKHCLDTDGIPGTFHSYSTGEDFEEFVCTRPGYYRIEVSNGNIFPPQILQNFVCLEYKPEPEPEPEPEPMSDAETQLYDARKSLQTAYQNHVNLGPYYTKDVIVGFGTYDDTLIIDIPSKYTDHDSIQIIKKEIRHIVGDQVKTDYAIYDEPIERHIETVIPYLWNKTLHQKNIDFAPKEMSYFNDADGFKQHDRVCSPLVAPNGTEFYISSTFDLEPFQITGTFIDKTEPDDCHKIWRTEVIMQEPDRVTALWLENED